MMPIEPSDPPSSETRDGPSLPVSGLVLVSTPIGNLSDISYRARETLQACDLILCEDTRHTARLLSSFDIRARTESLHDHNEDARIRSVLERLLKGQAVALVSDAGTPLVSDPGFKLVRACIEAGIKVSAVPGANAATTALVISGLPPVPFLFMGFPPPRSAARRSSFGQLRAAEMNGLSATFIWYEAPHRLLETLGDLKYVFGDRDAVVARELTKRFETVQRGTLSGLEEFYGHEAPRGEITLLVAPRAFDGPDDLDERLLAALKVQSLKDAAAFVSTVTGLPRKVVYARALEITERDVAPVGEHRLPQR